MNGEGFANFDMVMPLHRVITLMNQVDNQGNPVVFEVEMISVNRQKKTGGRRIILQRACLSRTKQKRSGCSGKNNSDYVQAKAPNHEENGTVNFLNLANNTIVKGHWKLITMFNGQRVI